MEQQKACILSSCLPKQAKTNQADNPTWKEPMNGPEAKAHWEAHMKEINALKVKHAWDIAAHEHLMNIVC